MNPLTNIRSRQRQREQEVINGIPESASYHSDYRNSAYIYAGQLSFNLTEGDLVAMFSQFGEIVDVNLVRDKNTQKSRGFAFLAYEDQRSTELAVDNLNGVTVDGRVISVDHVKDYKRLVDNPDYVDTNAQQAADVPTSAQANQPLQPSDRILSGAEAEAMEDELGTSGVPDRDAPAAHASGQGHRTLADRAPGGSGTSIAEMLREVEAKIGGDWRTRGKDGGLASKQFASDDGEDSRRLLAARQVREGRGNHKVQYTKKTHENKSTKHSDRNRSRSHSKSPMPHQQRKETDHDGRSHAIRDRRHHRHRSGERR